MNMPPGPAQVLSSILSPINAFLGQHEQTIMISVSCVAPAMAIIILAAIGHCLKRISNDELLEAEREALTESPNREGTIKFYAFLKGYKRLLDKCFK